MKVFKRIKWSYVVLSAMFLLLGIYLVVNPETSLVMICRILGAAMAVFGVMKIVLYFIREVEGVAIRFDFAVGLFCIILGALMLWRAPATDILSVVIGLLVLVDSVFKLQVAVDSRRMGAHCGGSRSCARSCAWCWASCWCSTPLTASRCSRS